MCLIVASPQGNLPSIKALVYAADKNPDGWGVVFHRKGKNQTIRGFDLDDLVEELYSKVIGHPYLLHFRWATHGTKIQANNHPFRIGEIYMAHNGVLTNVEIKDERYSDTYHFAAHLEEQFKLNPGWYGSKNFREVIKKYIGFGNKLAFFNSKGKLLLINEQMGFWYQNMWFSNTYSLPAWYGVSKKTRIAPQQKPLSIMGSSNVASGFSSCTVDWKDKNRTWNEGHTWVDNYATVPAYKNEDLHRKQTEFALPADATWDEIEAKSVAIDEAELREEIADELEADRILAEQLAEQLNEKGQIIELPAPVDESVIAEKGGEANGEAVYAAVGA